MLKILRTIALPTDEHRHEDQPIDRLADALVERVDEPETRSEEIHGHLAKTRDYKEGMRPALVLRLSSSRGTQTFTCGP